MDLESLATCLPTCMLVHFHGGKSPDATTTVNVMWPRIQATTSFLSLHAKKREGRGCNVTTDTP